MKQTLSTFALVVSVGFSSFSQQFNWLDSLHPNIVVGDTSSTYGLTDAMKAHNVNSIALSLVNERSEIHKAAYAMDTDSLNPETLYQAGSISKPVTALGVLVLARKYQLDLDTSINTYLSSWKLESSEFDVNKVTIRNLLSHTSGLNVHGFMGYRKKKKLPEISEILDGKGNSDPVKLAFYPDSVWRYSGGGYQVLHLLIEDVSEEDFASFMKREVLNTIGMSNSTFSLYLQGECSNCASAYNQKREAYEPSWYLYPESAAAGLWTNAEDLAIFLIYLREIYNGSEGIVSPSYVKQMFTPVLNNYGLGFFVEENEGNLHVGHSGKNMGFSNEMSINLNTGRAYVLMSDSDGAFPLFNEIKRSIPEMSPRGIRPQVVIKPVEVSLALLRNYSGKYSFIMGNGKKYKVELLLENDNLVINDKNMGVKHLLIPTSEHTFISQANGIEVFFKKEGDIQTLVWDKRLTFRKK